MTPDIDELIHGYLDGTLLESQEAQLNDWVKAGPQNAAAFADAVRLHDRLRSVIQEPQTVSQNKAIPFEGIARPMAGRVPRSPWRRFGAASGLAAAAALVVLLFWFARPTPASAQAELDRLIVAPSTTVDRIYRITSLDPSPAPGDGRQPPIDGATLSVGTPDKYVLERHYPDGRKFITGSDGQHSWAIPPDGSVRVSGDPLRFRGPVPGHQHGIPFANLRSDLVELRDAYVVSVLKPQSNGWRGLLAEKKSVEYRGPRRVELWYDPTTVVIHRMVFDGMPRERGGPDRVSMELLEQRNLGPEFFDHSVHHGPERVIVQED